MNVVSFRQGCLSGPLSHENMLRRTEGCRIFNRRALRFAGGRAAELEDPSCGAAEVLGKWATLFEEVGNGGRGAWGMSAATGLGHADVRKVLS